MSSIICTILGMIMTSIKIIDIMINSFLVLLSHSNIINHASTSYHWLYNPWLSVCYNNKKSFLKRFFGIYCCCGFVSEDTSLAQVSLSWLQIVCCPTSLLFLCPPLFHLQKILITFQPQQNIEVTVKQHINICQLAVGFILFLQMSKNY